MTGEPTAAPIDVATCMYYTGIDPFTKQQVYVAKLYYTGIDPLTKEEVYVARGLKNR